MAWNIFNYSVSLHYSFIYSCIHCLYLIITLLGINGHVGIESQPARSEGKESRARADRSPVKCNALENINTLLSARPWTEKMCVREEKKKSHGIFTVNAERMRRGFFLRAVIRLNDQTQTQPRRLSFSTLALDTVPLFRLIMSLVSRRRWRSCTAARYISISQHICPCMIV